MRGLYEGRRLLWDAGGVVEASFLWWRRRFFPLRRWAPVELSPVDVWVDGRVLKECLEFCGIVVGGVEELFEHPDAGTLFLEKLNNCFSFPLVGGGGVRR